MTKTLQEALVAVESALASAGRGEARVLAEWLVAAAAGIGRLEVLIQGDRLLDEQARVRLDGWVRRVALGEPLQYVLGSAPFLGRDFACDARALIPRPETEELCERVLGDASIWAHPAPRIADVGTGTGCLAVTLALDRSAAVVTAIDISPDAIALAKSNARRFGAEGRIHWRQGDLLAGVPEDSLDAVVSNPPYIAEDEWTRLDMEVRDHEPRLALVGGADGLALIRRLIEQAGHVLTPGGKLWLEIGNEQGPAVRELLASRGFEAVATHRDCAGHERIAEARQPS
ncbi:MAG TPA: peptide chain release factor N(5)-glutamine methyltransferase [Kiritimatiellia bacterium]|nr:peptide chain release factor N(5)-glutamine methyltransferase [Kiritimatiellia bacterium]